MAGKPVASGGGGGAKAAVSTIVPEKQKPATTGYPTIGNSATTQVKDPNPQASGNGSDRDVPNIVGQAPMNKPVGDFVMALITQAYHKHRNKLINLIEALGGDLNAMVN
jgi:hypothetical protein